MSDLREFFSSDVKPEHYQRVSSTHPLDLYKGKDPQSRWSLLLIGDTSYPPKATSSSIIFAETRIRPDRRWTITLSLADNHYQDLFLVFCDDIIKSALLVSDKKAALLFVIERYNKWRSMFSGTQNPLLSPAQIKGLLGEMFFLKTVLIPEYGNPKAVFSWTGPRNLPQDFILDDTWFEVKTISPKQPIVQISSIEQLDCNASGYLVVIHADRTSVTDQAGLNLNRLYYDLVSTLPADEDKITFSNMLLKYGYLPRSEYELPEYTFSIKDVTKYVVNSEFPCLRRAQLPDSIDNAKYSILLNSVKNFKKD